MRSNLSVGMPIDLLVVRRDACDAELNYRIEPGEPYFQDLRERWSAALRAAHIAIPRPPYRNAADDNSPPTRAPSRRNSGFHARLRTNLNVSVYAALTSAAI